MEYFAFAESIEPLEESLLKQGLPEDHELSGLVRLRNELELPGPTHVLWLDCIESEYFLDLEWTARKMDDTRPEQREERRRNIQNLEDERMAVMQLLLCSYSKQESEPLGLLGRFQWHSVEVTDDGQVPVIVSQDYTLAEEQGAIQRLHYYSNVEKEILGRLYNVFNVDFIAEMQGTNFRGPDAGAGQPQDPGGDGGAPEAQTEAVSELLEMKKRGKTKQIYLTRSD